MSYYDDDRPQRQRSDRDRNRDRDQRFRESDYAQDTSYSNSRGGGGGGPRDARDTSLVRRGRNESVDSIEEVQRDFPPGDRGGYVRETTIRKSGTRPARTRSMGGGRDRNDDRSYDDHSTYIDSRRGGGDEVAYSRRSEKRYDERSDRGGRGDRGDRRRRRDSYSDSSVSRSPPRRERRKSLGEQALAALGLGGAAGALLGKKDGRDRSRSRDRGGRGRARSYSSGRSRSRGGKRSRSKSRGPEITQALKAAALAGVGEAFRARKEPGGWTGAKGKRILTAAISAGGVDGLITGTGNRDAEHHSTRHVIESALAGLATNRLVNGPRSKSRGRDGSPGRGRGGSGGGGIGELLAAGGAAAGAKGLYDRFRSKSRDRGRGRSRSSSYSSYDSRSPPRRGEKGRSQSISAYASKGLAALGLTDVAKKIDGNDRRSPRRHDDYEHSRDSPGGYSDSVGQPRSGPDGLPQQDERGGPRGPGYKLDYGPHHNGDPQTDSDSDLGSSSGEEKERKKMRGTNLLTAGLATIATVHAAHSIYQSAEKREKREKELKKGEITEEEAKKSRNKGLLQDAASVGIAALGVKGAFSEWMEVKEKRKEKNEKHNAMIRHAAKRRARREKMEEEARRYRESGYTGSLPNLYTPQGNGYAGPTGPYSAGPTYYDDNPYSSTTTVPQGYVASGALPPPPPGAPPPPNPNYNGR